MTWATIAIVIAGIALAAAVGIAGGFDATSAVLFGLISALGFLAVVVAHKSVGGAVAPRTCASCGGLISHSAPTCKHCGAAQEA